MAYKKILGIGSALVDILIQIPNDQILNELNLPKGSMTYVNADDAVKIGEKVAQQFGSQHASGGSTANTTCGLSRLGVETGFLSKIGKDEVGEFFKKQMIDCHVKPQLLTTDTPSGRVIAMVTPDGERTFATCLGATIEMGPDDIHPDLLDGWDIFYVEGYLVANPNMLRKAVETAKVKGLKIAIDLASYNVVEESRDFLMELIENYVDIVFANEKESFALTGLEPESALHFIAERCETCKTLLPRRFYRRLCSILYRVPLIFERGCKLIIILAGQHKRVDLAAYLFFPRRTFPKRVPFAVSHTPLVFRFDVRHAKSKAHPIGMIA